MNKIINANINGFIFPIDEIAYEQLKIYLEQLRRGISDSEVYQDLEIRIAELFSHKLKSGKPAILEGDVNEVIVQLGSVDELVDSSEAEFKESFATGSEIPDRKLFRDLENRAVLGVCAGLAAYLQWDIKWVRVAFVLAVFFSGGVMLVIYGILGIALTPAVTPAEKLQMHGKPVTLDNLSSVFGDAAKNTVKNGKPLVESLAKNTMPILAKILAAIALAFLLVITVPALFSIIVSAGVVANILGNLGHYFFFNYTQAITVFFAAVVVAIIPVISIFYSLIRILVNGKKLSWIVRVPLIVIWWVAFAYLMGQSIYLGQEFSSYQEISSGMISPDSTFHKNEKTVVIAPMPMQMDAQNGVSKNEFDVQWGNKGMEEDEFTINGRNMMETMEKSRGFDIELKILRTIDSLPYVVLKKSSMGKGRGKLDNASAIEYRCNWTGNKLMLSDYFTLGKNKRWRNQEVEIRVYLPVGYQVQVDERLPDYLDVEYDDNF